MLSASSLGLIPARFPKVAPTLQVRITNIRSGEDDPGLQEAEGGFVRLLDRLTNGSQVEVSDTGTQLTYRPGVLLGGRVEHPCSAQRAIGYSLEPILALAPFCKEPLHLTLTGVTNNQQDPSPDWIKASCLPVLRRFLSSPCCFPLLISTPYSSPLLLFFLSSGSLLMTRAWSWWCRGEAPRRGAAAR